MRQETTVTRPDRLRSWLLAGLLAGILLLALALRLDGVAFGLPAINDPDELMFQMGAVRLLSGPTLNPGWFGHPATTTIYLLAVNALVVFAAGWAAGWWAGPKAFVAAVYSNPTWLMLPGRLAMVAFGVLCVWLTYRLGRELFGRRVGVAAALLMAVNPLHVAYSQVIRSDIMATSFMLLCLLAVLHHHRGGTRRDLCLASLWLALAIITKWPYALTVLALAGIAFLRVRDGVERFGPALRRLVLFGLLTLGLVVLLSPYIVLDYPVLLRNLQGEAQPYHLGATGGTMAENLLWYARGPLFTSFGPAGCLILLGGCVLMRRQREALALLLPVAAGFILVTITQALVWERWMLSLVPLFAIVAALAAVRLIDAVPRPARTAAGALLAAAVLTPLIYRSTAHAEERTHDTRQAAAIWVKSHVPAGKTILVEHFAFELLSGPWEFRFPMGDAGCVDVKSMLSGRIGYAAIQSSRGQRSNVDYGTLTPSTRDTCRSDYAILTQADRYAAERGRFPQEDEAYRALIAQGSVAATFGPEPGKRGGPIVRVVSFPPAK